MHARERVHAVLDFHLYAFDGSSLRSSFHCTHSLFSILTVKEKSDNDDRLHLVDVTFIVVVVVIVVDSYFRCTEIVLLKII
jgi:hypothetical protein